MKGIDDDACARLVKRLNDHGFDLWTQQYEGGWQVHLPIADFDTSHRCDRCRRPGLPYPPTIAGDNPPVIHKSLPHDSRSRCWTLIRPDGLDVISYNCQECIVTKKACSHNRVRWQLGSTRRSLTRGPAVRSISS